MNYRLTVPNLSCPIGWTDKIGFKADLEATPKNGEPFKWDAIRIDCMRISHPAHLMLIEGVVPAWLFMGAKLTEIADPTQALRGPLMLLRMNCSPLHQVPLTLTDVVFGTPTQVPEGAKYTDLVPAMFYTLYTNPQAW